MDMSTSDDSTSDPATSSGQGQRPGDAGRGADAGTDEQRGWEADPEGDVPRSRDRAIDFDANTEMIAIAVAEETGTPVEEAREVVRATKPPRRGPLLVQGLAPALVAAALAGASAFGAIPLAVALLVLQVFLVLGLLALLDAPASGGAFVIAVGAAVAADVAVLLDDGEVDRLAGVVALALVAALAHQLLRRKRGRVTEALADTLVCVVAVVASACLLGLHQLDGGEQTVVAALAAAGTALLVGRVADRFAASPVLAVGSTRGWPGLLLALAGAVGAAVVLAQLGGDIAVAQAVLLGLVCAGTVVAADLAVDLAAAELRAGWRDARRVAALRPAGMTVPFALLGPVALVAGRLVLG